MKTIKKSIKTIEKELAKVKKELADIKEEFKVETKYPIYKKSIGYNQIVKFTGLEEGIIICKGVYSHDVGYSSSNWQPHTNKKVWKDIAFDEERGLYHKQLVWCWDDSDTHAKTLRFYDAVNISSFSFSGGKDGYLYSSYEPYEETWPEWAKEAYKTLED